MLTKENHKTFTNLEILTTSNCLPLKQLLVVKIGSPHNYLTTRPVIPFTLLMEGDGEVHPLLCCHLHHLLHHHLIHHVLHHLLHHVPQVHLLDIIRGGGDINYATLHFIIQYCTVHYSILLYCYVQ